MFYLPFWIMAAVLLALAIISAVIKGFDFVDFLVIVMVIALSMSADMLFCKQFGLYYISSIPNRGWYSFWAGILVYPSLAITFLKFKPSGNKAVLIYTLLWVVALTVFELLIVVPYKITMYPKWRIIPWSPIMYLIGFSSVYFYHGLLKGRIRKR